MVEEIPFPFKPYPQQRDLMRSIYDCVEASSVGCFESPTGTGKSLSVICATLSWQFQEEKRILSEQEAVPSDKKVDVGDDWLKDFQSSFENDTTANKEKKNAYDHHLAMKDRVQRLFKLNQRQQTLNNLPTNILNKSIESKKDENPPAKLNNQGTEPDDEFALKYYESDEEQQRSKSRQILYGDEEEEENSRALSLPKIFYCSRTHSQISQFVNEIKCTAFASARCVTLGSRRNLCINSEVTSLKSDSRMSERCLEKQKGDKKIQDVVETDNNSEPPKRKQKTKTSENKPCEFKSKQKEKLFADHALGTIRDIESLMTLGDQTKACPYYATRRTLHDAQIVCMPYNMLLHDELRSSMGIDLSNSVVIFDEAHNLVEAVNHIYSADVSYDQLKLAEHCVKEYAKRFQAILTGKNYYYVNILISVISGLIQSLNLDHQENTMTANAKQTSLTAELEKQRRSGLTDKSIMNENKNIKDIAGLSPDENMAPIGTSTVPTVDILGTNDFIFLSSLDNVNLFKLRRHVTETNLTNKVGGYADHQEKIRAAAAASAAEDLLKHSVSIRAKGQIGKAKSRVISEKPCVDSCGNDSQRSSNSTNEFQELHIQGSYTQALRSVLTLITCLTNADVDGRIVITKNIVNSYQQKIPAQQPYTATSASAPLPSSSSSSSPSSSIKFILLNPSAHFQKIVDQARSVLLLGGTLQPFSYIKSFLFPRVPSNKVSLFACGHVVAESNVMTLVVSSGPNGGQLEFTHSNRMLPSTLIDLHASLRQVSSIVPNGLVVFFSSYQYMAGVISKWHAMGLYNELSAVQPLFVEPRLAADAERVWLSYSEQALTGGRGAMLFCVMGGKLSEGINFSDKLARCVVVIGMPYPDGRDPVLQEKLKFADLMEGDGKAGKRLYEAMCMKIVNQCIGRAIRHVNDYATIVLLDRRFSQQRISSQLPMWLSREIHHSLAFNEVKSKLKSFFSNRVDDRVVSY